MRLACRSVAGAKAIQDLFDLAGAQAFLLQQMQDDARIKRTAARGHGNSVEG